MSMISLAFVSTSSLAARYFSWWVVRELSNRLTFASIPLDILPIYRVLRTAATVEDLAGECAAVGRQNGNPSRMTKRRPSAFDLGINGNLDARYKREDLRIRNRVFAIVRGRYVPSKGHHGETVVHIHLRCRDPIGRYSQAVCRTSCDCSRHGSPHPCRPASFHRPGLIAARQVLRECS